MEINSGVVLNQFIEDNFQNYNIAKKIYGNAILAMFTFLFFINPLFKPFTAYFFVKPSKIAD